MYTILIPDIAQKWEVTLRIPLPNRVETWRLSFIKSTNFSRNKSGQIFQILVKFAKVKSHKIFFKIQKKKKKKTTPKKFNRSQNFQPQKNKYVISLCEYILEHNWDVSWLLFFFGLVKVPAVKLAFWLGVYFTSYIHRVLLIFSSYWSIEWKSLLCNKCFPNQN